jgi:hypothetical protein
MRFKLGSILLVLLLLLILLFIILLFILLFLFSGTRTFGQHLLRVRVFANSTLSTLRHLFRKLGLMHTARIADNKGRHGPNDSIFPPAGGRRVQRRPVRWSGLPK